MTIEELLRLWKRDQTYEKAKRIACPLKNLAEYLCKTHRSWNGSVEERKQAELWRGGKPDLKNKL